jgi:hypothetical protein
MIEAMANPGRLSPARWFSHDDSLFEGGNHLSSEVEKTTPVVIDNQRGLSYLMSEGDARIIRVYLCALGHSSIVVTQRHARLTDEHVRAEAERIAGNR